MKKLLVIVLAACAAFAATPHRASAGECGISGKGTLWVDFADGSVPFWQEFARPGRDRGRGQLHLPAAAARARGQDRLLGHVPSAPGRDAARAVRPRRRDRPREPHLRHRSDVERLHPADDRRERAERRQHAHALERDERAVPPQRPDLPSDPGSARCPSGPARPQRALHGRGGRRLVAPGLDLRGHRARVVLRRAADCEAGPGDGQQDAAHALPPARRRVHERRHLASQARADARLPHDSRLGRPRARAAGGVAPGDEAPGAGRAPGGQRARPALGLVVGLGRLERGRDRSGQARGGLRLSLGPIREAL